MPVPSDSSPINGAHAHSVRSGPRFAGFQGTTEIAVDLCAQPRWKPASALSPGGRCRYRRCPKGSVLPSVGTSLGVGKARHRIRPRTTAVRNREGRNCRCRSIQVHGREPGSGAETTTPACAGALHDRCAAVPGGFLGTRCGPAGGIALDPIAGGPGEGPGPTQLSAQGRACGQPDQDAEAEDTALISPAGARVSRSCWRSEGE
jgi:hypothetical protein